MQAFTTGLEMPEKKIEGQKWVRFKKATPPPQSEINVSCEESFLFNTSWHMGDGPNTNKTTVQLCTLQLGETEDSQRYHRQRERERESTAKNVEHLSVKNFPNPQKRWKKTTEMAEQTGEEQEQDQDRQRTRKDIKCQVAPPEPLPHS